MRKHLLIATILLISFSACKSTKKISPAPVVEDPVVEVAEEPVVSEVKEVMPEPEPPVVMKTEEVKLEKSTDTKLHAFYVIIGSFTQVSNAEKLQADQNAMGEKSVILKSESGMFRVANLGTDSEQEARTKISTIRKGKQFPDVWLLKSK